MPGPNKLRFDFISPKLANSNTTNPIHSSYLTLNYVPPLASPPLQLVILLGSDSPGTYDAVPARIEKEGNDLDMAIAKFRMAAYLWQAYTVSIYLWKNKPLEWHSTDCNNQAEQMHRNKLGRRTFRLEEDWTTGTSNFRDRETGGMRSEAKVHVVRSSKTVAEIRDANIAQQNKNATNPGALYGIAMEAMNKYFKPRPGQKHYVSCLILDSHWDKSQNLILGHAALGGEGGNIALGICGSHALQSYPSSLEEVVPAFTDCTPTDTDYVANDCGESGSSWEAANIGIGAHMHETGHLFGLPHQVNGVMARDYVTLNRSFTTREPYSTRTQSRGGIYASPNDECTWHRLDVLQFKTHPCFALPTDPVRYSDDTVQAWPVGNGQVIVTAVSGIALIEIYTEGDDCCRYWMEYGDGNGLGPIQRQIILTELALRDRIPEEKRKSKLKLKIKSIAGGSHEIQDFNILTSKGSQVKLSNGQLAFRSSKLGFSEMEGSTPEEVIFGSAVKQTCLMLSIKIYHGFALDGLEFFYEDHTHELFGKRGGQPGGSEFVLGKCPHGANYVSCLTSGRYPQRRVHHRVLCESWPVGGWSFDHDEFG